MKKALTWIWTGMLLASIVSMPSFGQTAEEFLDRMIEAQGGRKLLAGLMDSTVSGTLEAIQQGVTGTLTMYQKEPNKMRMDIEVMGFLITQAYDGQQAWMTNPQTGGVQVMDENMAKEFKRQAMGNDAVLNPAKLGITYLYKGKEKAGDREYLVLEQTLADGYKNTFYLDPATHLIAKTKARVLNQTGVEVDSETLLSDYRSEGGVMTAHSLTVFQSGQEFARMNLTKFVFNSGLQDDLFQMKN
jgi:outer membrane lipoprotein-sorting protein